MGENKNNNKEFKTNVAHQYGTFLKLSFKTSLKFKK